jgi:glutaredoxin
MTNITILTQADCASCVEAKDLLSRLALEYLMQVREVGLDTDDGRKLAARHGVVFAPGILLEGDLFSYGRLSEKKLRRHLSRGKATADAGA